MHGKRPLSATPRPHTAPFGSSTGRFYTEDKRESTAPERSGAGVLASRGGRRPEGGGVAPSLSRSRGGNENCELHLNGAGVSQEPPRARDESSTRPVASAAAGR
eukprot:2107824-Prymnesium_polylepis.1